MRYSPHQCAIHKDVIDLTPPEGCPVMIDIIKYQLFF